MDILESDIPPHFATSRELFYIEDAARRGAILRNVCNLPKNYGPLLIKDTDSDKQSRKDARYTGKGSPWRKSNIFFAKAGTGAPAYQD